MRGFDATLDTQDMDIIKRMKWLDITLPITLRSFTLLYRSLPTQPERDTEHSTKAENAPR
ncbi:hypothetical protein GCM10007047_21770 [Cerasicoccus arenae]|uniref:Uncharacterized protein n=1 Tax=Cerasicoccus arenae TaxID=424488 RepID=A0A8J3DCU7_9BACT|nr:hypothetical protein GCM10007047_21770 [Cerasicoccus arenae]